MTSIGPAPSATSKSATSGALRRPRGVFRTLRRMELAGTTQCGPARAAQGHEPSWQRGGAVERFQTIADLPQGFVEDQNTEARHQYERQTRVQGYRRGFVHLIREVYEILDGVNPDKRALRQIMHEIVRRVLEPDIAYGAMGVNPSSAEVEFVVSERETFLCLGGAECLLRVIHSIRVEEQEQAKLPARAGSGVGVGISVDGRNPVTDARAMHRRNVGDRNDVRAQWETPVPRVDHGIKERQDTTRTAILNDAMGILRELCYFSLPLAQQLCDKDGLIVYLFQLMEKNDFFDNAAGLVEEILAVREDSFDLSRIPRLYDIIQSFSSRQLAFFCRVLALVVFEPEDRRLLETSKVIKSMELLKLRRNRLLRADNIVDRNHAIIFNSPLILTRLLLVLRMQNFYFAVNRIYEPISNEMVSSAEFAMLLSRTTDGSDWASIEELTANQTLTSSNEFSVLRHGLRESSPPGDHNHNHSPHSPLSIESAILRDLILRNRSPGDRAREDLEAQVIMKSIVLAPYRVEVLFVLCTLLNGKRKIDFQDRLAEMGLVSILNDMFGKFEWKTSVQPSQIPLHGPGCGCSLDASLKIQFLRLIHNFCDRDYSDNSSKLLLLNKHELSLLKQSDGQPIDLNHAPRGLLCQIIHTLIEQPADSVYRFWLSSCVEAFLRRATPNEQLFVARTPLLRCLVTEILNGGAFRAQGTFQSAFDLLGEMTKGNWQTLQLFHRQLSEAQFTSFMEVVIRNLVDSNVFVRSMLLSAEKFGKMTVPSTFGLSDDDMVDRMSRFLSVNVVRLLRDLMTIVTMDDVNHENICCLNTAIVILIFQHRRRRLPIILDALREQEAISGTAITTCQNFRGLLWFWIQYYAPRGRDRLSLEHSSDVKFEEWRQVVSLLCADDGSSTALLTSPMRLPLSLYSRFYSASTREPRSC